MGLVSLVLVMSYPLMSTTRQVLSIRYSIGAALVLGYGNSNSNNGISHHFRRQCFLVLLP